VKHRLVVGDVLVKGISVAVSDTDFEGVESRENVELGDGDLREGIEAHSVTEQDEVQPSRTTPAARVRPVFMSELDEHVALFVGHLRGHGARANPGHVRLGDTYDAVDVPGTDTRADARTARGGVRGRDEG